jgi:hypothetical protein
MKVTPATTTATTAAAAKAILRVLFISWNLRAGHQAGR